MLGPLLSLGKGERMIYVYTEQDTSPRFFEVIRAIKAELGIHDIVMAIPAARFFEVHPSVPVVVFGKIEDPEYTHTNNVFTYSPAQVLTKANVVTVVGAAFKLALQDVPEVPHAPANGVDVVRATNSDFMWGERYDQILKEPEVVIDIEVSGNITKGTPEDDDVELLSIAFYLPQAQKSIVFQGDYYNAFGARSCIVYFAWFLAHYTGKCIYHNGKFDTRVLNRLGAKVNVFASVDEDTMLMHHVLYQAAGMHGLKGLCKMYFNAPDWEAPAKKYTKGGGHYENIPFAELAEYNGLDVYWTYMLYQRLRPLIDVDEAAVRAYELEREAAAFLLKVEARGIPFDQRAADELQELCEAVMADELAAMRALTGNEKFNPNSPMQVKAYLAELGEEVAGTSVEILSALREDFNGDETAALFIDSLLVYRKRAKINSTYVKGWGVKVRDGKVHPTFLVHGTSTGRLSSSSPNSQNLPRSKEVRKIVGI